MKKAFTIVEMLAAIALMLVVMSVVAGVYRSAVRSYQLAEATLDITRRADAICQQIRSDLAAMRPEMPLAVWFERTADGRRLDQILFFANGDFQSVKRYNQDATEKTLVSNVARIQYAPAWRLRIDDSASPWQIQVIASYAESRLLARRAHLLTAENNLGYDTLTIPFPVAANFNGDGFVPFWNNILEYDQFALSEWQNVLLQMDNCKRFLQVCFDTQIPFNIASEGLPYIDLASRHTQHLLFSDGVETFQIQWAYTADDLTTSATDDTATLPAAERFDGVRWWPQDQATGFGVYFNLGGGVDFADWLRVKPLVTETDAEKAQRRCQVGTYYFRTDFWPKAFKVTIRLADRKGLVAGGRTFTAIVPIRGL